MMKRSETSQEVFRVSTFCVVLNKSNNNECIQELPTPKTSLYISHAFEQPSSLLSLVCMCFDRRWAASEAAGLAEPHPRNSTDLALTYWTYLQNLHSHRLNRMCSFHSLWGLIKLYLSTLQINYDDDRRRIRSSELSWAKIGLVDLHCCKSTYPWCKLFINAFSCLMPSTRMS
jgi:hypothetical protein